MVTWMERGRVKLGAAEDWVGKIEADRLSIIVLFAIIVTLLL